MSVNIYNSLTKQKEELVPIDGKTINMYSCGVTVYDKCHIGHARSLYIFDVIRRYLKFRGYNVKFIRNITDVDDKIIKKANDLGKTFEEVVDENIKLYETDLDTLGIDRADVEPRATENINDMIEHIQGLIDKGFAYESEGDVYFSVKQFKDYGKLSGQSVDKMLEGVRINYCENKKDALDFALWKKAKDNEPSWPSPWGEGRPGWHIECSVMSKKYTGADTLDIHAGGRDLIFPHHENEIAQSEALTGKQFAKYWIHHGLLTINSQKMAKSLGNFITVQDAANKFPVEDLKMLFLTSHYSSPVDYSEDKMIEMQKSLGRIKIFLNESADVKDSSGKDEGIVKKFEDNFLSSMDEDFNTSKAIGFVFELIGEVYKLQGTDEYETCLKDASETITKLFKDIFSIDLKANNEVNDEVKALLKKRQEARDSKNYKLSDELRDKLKDMGIIVEDGKGGQKWRYA